MYIWYIGYVCIGNPKVVTSDEPRFYNIYDYMTVLTKIGPNVDRIFFIFITRIILLVS